MNITQEQTAHYKHLLELKESLPRLPTWKWNTETKTHDGVKIQPTAFIADYILQVSGEDGEGFVDYYGEFHGGYPYIHPELEQWAKAHNGYWEWQHPGAIGFVEN